jgi:hypothetical protein
MTEALVQVVHQAHIEGQGGDNGFKRETWIKAVLKAIALHKGRASITWDKAKNKWGDLKTKWKHWVKLSGLSGFGFNPDTELFEAYDYTWENLNKSDPGIIWHKTHVMPHRGEIGDILHTQQATGQGALTAADPTLIDP